MQGEYAKVIVLYNEHVIINFAHIITTFKLVSWLTDVHFNTSCIIVNYENNDTWPYCLDYFLIIRLNDLHSRKEKPLITVNTLVLVSVICMILNITKHVLNIRHVCFSQTKTVLFILMYPVRQSIHRWHE